jgi:hypothetical protein
MSRHVDDFLNIEEDNLRQDHHLLASRVFLTHSSLTSDEEVLEAPPAKVFILARQTCRGRRIVQYGHDLISARRGKLAYLEKLTRSF